VCAFECVLCLSVSVRAEFEFEPFSTATMKRSSYRLHGPHATACILYSDSSTGPLSHELLLHITLCSTKTHELGAKKGFEF
jgi:hypothetical protein